MQSIIDLAAKTEAPFAFMVLAIIGGITVMVCVRSTLRSVERQKVLDHQRTMDLKRMDNPKQITQSREEEL